MTIAQYFCPSCGTKVTNDEERSIKEYYLFRGYSYDTIVKLLSKQNEIQMGVRTLEYQLQSYGFRRQCPVYDLGQVWQRVAVENNQLDNYKLKFYKIVCHRAKQTNPHANFTTECKFI